MKKTVVMGLVVLGLAVSASAELLAGWYDGGNVATTNSADVKHSAVGARLFGTASAAKFDRTSSDLTYGTGALVTDAAPLGSQNALGLKDLEYIDIYIQNKTESGYTIELSSIVMDIAVPFKTPNIFHLEYVAGDLGITLGTEVGLHTGPYNDGVGAPGAADWADWDLDLSSSYTAAQLTLDQGENATFRLTITSDLGKTGASFVDNLAIGGTATVIPEPATLGLVASFGAAVMFIRRRLML